MSFIPEIKMDFVPSDEEGEIEINEVIEENLPDDINTAEDIKVEVKEEIELPVTQNVEDIFNMQPNIQENVKLTKKGKPRKKRAPMTEEQKEKLKKAREKAMAVRKARAEERKKEKDLDNQEKELLKKQKIKKVKKLKEEVEEELPPENVQETQPKKETNSFVGMTTFTKKDLEEAQLDAILKYDTIRKARKKEKQERLQKEKEANMVRETLRRQITPQKQYNPFDNCY